MQSTREKKGLIFLCQIAKGKTCCTIFVYDLWLSLWWLVNKTVPFCSATTSQILGLGLRTRPSSSTASSVLCLDGKSRRRDADYILTVEFRTLYKSFVFVVCSGAKSQINNKKVFHHLKRKVSKIQNSCSLWRQIS